MHRLFLVFYTLIEHIKQILFVVYSHKLYIDSITAYIPSTSSQKLALWCTITCVCKYIAMYVYKLNSQLAIHSQLDCGCHKCTKQTETS